jgi:EPS-associated MarR family transcriptional regulator
MTVGQVSHSYRVARRGDCVGEAESVRASNTELTLSTPALQISSRRTLVHAGVCKPKARAMTGDLDPPLLADETRYRVMRLLEAKPELSQRDVSRELGISLGKVNYCVQALIRKGLVKAARFKNNRNKAAYMYLLTPRGIEEKTSLTVEFLHIKMREYEILRAEIEQIRRDAARIT